MQAANPYIFKIKPYVPGKPIDEVRRELGLKSVIKLASNENPYPPSPKVLAAMARRPGRSIVIRMAAVFCCAVPWPESLISMMIS